MATESFSSSVWRTLLIWLVGMVWGSAAALATLGCACTVGVATRCLRSLVLVVALPTSAISSPWFKGIPSNEGAKEGHSPLKKRYFTAICSSNVKMVANRHRRAAIITSTGVELFRNVNIDDVEWPWTPKIAGFSEFFAISGCDAHFKSELRQNDGR